MQLGELREETAFLVDITTLISSISRSYITNIFQILCQNVDFGEC
jgi:hypothetical protein